MSPAVSFPAVTTVNPCLQLQRFRDIKYLLLWVILVCRLELIRAANVNNNVDLTDRITGASVQE